MRLLLRVNQEIQIEGVMKTPLNELGQWTSGLAPTPQLKECLANGNGFAARALDEVDEPAIPSLVEFSLDST